MHGVITPVECGIYTYLCRVQDKGLIKKIHIGLPQIHGRSISLSLLFLLKGHLIKYIDPTGRKKRRENKGFCGISSDTQKEVN